MAIIYFCASSPLFNFQHQQNVIKFGFIVSLYDPIRTAAVVRGNALYRKPNLRLRGVRAISRI